MSERSSAVSRPTVKLGVNVDHVATVRQARGTSEPDPVVAAALAELAGCHGITIHLREDRRHIQERDLEILRRTLTTRLNLEMAATSEMVDLALRHKPDIVCLVPERRQELTTEGGLDVAGSRPLVTEAVARLQDGGIPVSLFIDPEAAQIEAAAQTGAAFIELHTGRYADAPTAAAADEELDRLRQSAVLASGLGLRVNAGHGLNYRNVRPVARLEHLEELNIGHSIISRAVYVGLTQAVREMLALLEG
jgi:pyridoxine 5-phosphate synthase